MTAYPLTSPRFIDLKSGKFSRRSRLPLGREYVWKISTGVVRTITYLEDGNAVTLGFWGAGDVVGRVLSKANPFQIECVTPVEAAILPMSRISEATDEIILHSQRLQDFLEIVHSRPVDISLMRFLTWLAKRFGQNIEQGQLIDLRLTHQEIAETIGTTRVTVTRLLKDFENRGIIQRRLNRFVILHEQADWHYEI